jgi:hypothetical protein
VATAFLPDKQTNKDAMQSTSVNFRNKIAYLKSINHELPAVSFGIWIMHIRNLPRFNVRFRTRLLNNLNI